MPWSAGCPSFRGGAREAQEGRIREAGSPTYGKCSGEAEETHESIGPIPLRREKVRILAVSKPLESRGIVIYWSSEQQNAMSETTRRELAPKGVRLCGGERL
jgi:hypothetical protein